MASQLVTGVDFVTVPTGDYEAAGQEHAVVVALGGPPAPHHLGASSRPRTPPPSGR